MELPLQPLFHSLYTALGSPVSILVLMELPLQLYTIYILFIRRLVSILVLMELPLQHIFPLQLETWKRGFNPCFNGTTSATVSLNLGRGDSM